jgi:hypothetical protein
VAGGKPTLWNSWSEKTGRCGGDEVGLADEERSATLFALVERVSLPCMKSSKRLVPHESRRS